MNDNKDVRQASCCCGRLTAMVKGPPVRVSMCHCLECQKRTGSLFGAQARWPRTHVRIGGHSTEYVRVGDDGGTLRFNFCPYCGATVWYTVDDQPDIIAIPIGAFADPDFPMPRVSVYENRKHRWLEVPDSIERD